MPRLFSYSQFSSGNKIVRHYADKHTPVIICAKSAKFNEPFKIKVRIGKTIKHPNAQDHHFQYIQLWDLETLVGEEKLQRASFGDDPIHIEAFFTVLPKVSMRLKALVYCNKHGLWQSEEVFVKVDRDIED